MLLDRIHPPSCAFDFGHLALLPHPPHLLRRHLRLHLQLPLRLLLHLLHRLCERERFVHRQTVAV